MHYDEFYLKTPTELKGLAIIPLIIVGAFVLLSSQIFPTEIEPILPLGICAGMAFFVMYAAFALWEWEPIMRFRQMKKIVISGYGIALYRKDGNTARLIRWQQINEGKFRGVRHLHIGLLETHSAPGSIILNLNDGSDFEIPLHMILTDEDHLGMVTAIGRYLVAEVDTGASH